MVRSLSTPHNLKCTVKAKESQFTFTKFLIYNLTSHLTRFGTNVFAKTFMNHAFKDRCYAIESV